MTEIRAIVLLTFDLLRRFLREGIVLRSLVFPVGLAWGTIAATVFAVLLWRAPASVVLAHDLQLPDTTTEAALLADLEEAGWPITRVDDPKAWVENGRATVGSDGSKIWLHRTSADALAVEEVLRVHAHTDWRLKTRGNSKRVQATAGSSRILMQFIGALFAFYGVVFGAGSVARDRDQGTLESELAMPVATWVHGMSRWIAGTVLLSIFFTVSVLVFASLLPFEAPFTVVLHGIAACGGATAIGLIVIARAGLDAGFAGPMSTGLVVVVSLLSFGIANNDIGGMLPVASLLARAQNGWPPVMVSMVWGLLATWVFTIRSARS